MFVTFGQIVRLCEPANMTMRDAAETAFMARMGRFVFRARRRSIETLTDEAVNILEPTTMHEMAVSAGGSGIRPDQALVSFVSKYFSAEIVSRLTLCRASAKRVPMTLQALIVCAAETFADSVCASAPFDRALCLWPSSKQRVTVLAPSQIMHSAPASPGGRLAAIGNRAYPLNSHSERPVLRFGQNPLAALVTLGGFAICTAVFLKIQGFQQ